MLTPKQHELLLFIHQKLKETGVSPSFDEMKTALDLRSKSGIHRLVTALEERGFVRRLPHRARALEILKMPEEAAAGPARRLWEKGFSPEVVEGGLGKTTQTEDAHEVPILGRIAAGTPIEAIQSESGRIPAPAHLLRGGEHFALEVQGESMIEAGILDGDCVIIQRCDDASSGEIVVALVDDQEATLKRLRKRGASIALEAANPDFETRIFGPDRVRIQGRLVGLMREY